MALWVAIEPKDKGILALTTSRERNMLVAERFIQGLVKAHGRASGINGWRHMVSAGLQVPETEASPSFPF